jgi:hypothetical protein
LFWCGSYLSFAQGFCPVPPHLDHYVTFLWNTDCHFFKF